MIDQKRKRLFVESIGMAYGARNDSSRTEEAASW